MGMLRGLLLLGVLLPVAAWAEVGPQSFSAQVVKIVDGDTVALDNGAHVRLLDINTPELAHDGRPAEPHADVARDALRSLVFGRTVTIQTGKVREDRFGRVLGHIFLPGRGWVNGTLVRDGHAVVYTFADNAMYAPELLAYEQSARMGKKGLWALPDWGVRDAARCCAEGDIGSFKLVEGVVVASAHVKAKGGGRTYLNFGKDWRRDFSVFVADRDMKWFRKAGIKNLGDAYLGKRVRVHGVLQPVNGVLVHVTHPAQIEIVE